MFLLDTNVVSELRRADRADPGVRAWAMSVQQPQLYLSVMTVLEIEIGVHRLERNNDHAQAAPIRAWLLKIGQSFAGQILPVDVPIAMACARLYILDRTKERDALIAATALVYGLTVITRNVRDFAPLKVPLFNPWGR